MPIAVPVPERRAQAEGRPSGEGPPQQREQRERGERGERGARREKRTRDRPPQSGEAPPPEGSQAPVESRQAPRAAAEAGGPTPQELSAGGPSGAHRRGSRRGGGGQRGERSGGQGMPATEAEGASKAVDAPPGTPPLQTAYLPERCPLMADIHLLCPACSCTMSGLPCCLSAALHVASLSQRACDPFLFWC